MHALFFGCRVRHRSPCTGESSAHRAWLLPLDKHSGLDVAVFLGQPSPGPQISVWSFFFFLISYCELRETSPRFR